MTYQVTYHGNTRITVERDGVLAYEMERENGGTGFWELYPVHDGVRGARITTDQYSNDLLGRVTGGLLRGGHLARVDGGFVVSVPANASDFYVSGTGYLCCKQPVRMVLTERPVDNLGINSRQQLRPATQAEREAAGLDVNDATMSALFLEVAV